MKVIPKM